MFPVVASLFCLVVLSLVSGKMISFNPEYDQVNPCVGDTMGTKSALWCFTCSTSRSVNECYGKGEMQPCNMDNVGIITRKVSSAYISSILCYVMFFTAKIPCTINEDYELYIKMNFYLYQEYLVCIFQTI